MKHMTIEDRLREVNPHSGEDWKVVMSPWVMIAAIKRLLQTLDGHNTGARADVAAILGVDDLKPKFGPQ